MTQRMALYLQDKHDIRYEIEIAKYAEQQGFSEIWQADTRLARDCVVMMSALLAETSRIRVGSGVLPIYTRNPAVIAATWSTMWELGGLTPEGESRVMLGLGAWWEPIASRVGADRRKPLTAMRENVEAIRQLFTMEEVSYEGEFVQLDRVRLDVAYGDTSPRDIPIYIGATGPKMLELSGEICDGPVLNYVVSTDYIAEAVELVTAGGAKAGKSLAEIDRPELLACSLSDDDPAEAIMTGKSLVAYYLGTEPHIMKASGADPELVERVQQIVGWPATEDDYRKAAHLIPDELVRKLMAVGTSSECRDTVAGYIEAGVTCPILYPLMPDIKPVVDAFAVDALIFTHATVLTMNSDRVIIEDGAILVTDDRIGAIGKTAELVETNPQEQQIDLSGHIVLPGLIDAHVHTAQCMLRGVSEGKRLADFSNWLFGRIFPLQGSYTEEDARASASLCILEMIKSGTTGFVECLLAERYGFDGIAQLCVDSGIRAALGKVVMDVNPETRDQLGWHHGMWQTRESSIEGTVAAHDAWDGSGDGRLQVWFGCRSAEPANDPSLFDEVSALARDRDMGITIHLAELAHDNQYARAQGYRSHVEFAHGHGLLGPRTVLAHCTIADEQDIALLAATGTSVAHNPGNNAAAAWGPAPIADMLDAGVNVAIGCDGAPSNANMDVLRDLRIACHTARMRTGTRLALGPEAALEMATINGARALGIGADAGSLEVGKKADFISIDTDAPHLQPVWNPVATAVFAAQGGDVDTVVINGQVIMRNRKVLTMNEEEILDDVRGRFRDVASRAGVEGLTPEWPIV